MKQSISELSNLTGMDRRRIRRALSDLSADKGRKGALLYESAEALPLLYLAPGENDTYDLTQERARLAHHQADKAEIEAEALRGSLIEVDQVADLVGEEYANVRAKLLAIPVKLAPLMLVAEGVNEARDLIQDSIYEALEELAADGGESF